MIKASDRTMAVELIKETVAAGARQAKACEVLGISARTYQRWTQHGGVKVDGRPSAARPEPGHKLSDAEREHILRVINEPAYQSLPPSQIVPKLADRGIYLASESTFYRVMREAKQQNRRGRSRAPQTHPIHTHKASEANQVWCWDITWLPGPAKGVYFYLYLILDLYSRKVVGWEVYESESSEQASQLIRKAHLSEGVGTSPLVLHSDNGSPMKGASLQETLYKLGITSSRSRPRVSNDNAYAESLFKTCKYVPGFPYKGFGNLHSARQWVYDFIQWYNHDHQHSAIKFVTPAQRHDGLDIAILQQRDTVYQRAKAQNPNRWTSNTRNWKHKKDVWLNPTDDNQSVKAA
jgi:putative transposase